MSEPQTVIEALRSTPVAPFLDLPLPQLPPLPEIPQVQQIASQLGIPAAQPTGDPGAGAAAAPPAPALPPNPLDALMNGAALPALPGVDALLKPMTDLLGGFGTGNLGAFDPTQIFDMSSKVIDTAMQSGTGALKTLEQVWQSQAGQNAQTTGKEATAQGDQVSQQGKDISTVTREAADAVARGYAKLVGIAQEFIATAVAAAPVAFTPPGQAMLIASASEHIAMGLEVVAETRGELAVHMGSLGALAGLAGGAGGPSPAAIASSVVENVGKPIMSTVSDLGKSAVEAATTQAASVGSPDSSTLGGFGGGGSGGASTHAASVGSHGGGGGGGGMVGGGAGIGGGFGGGSSGSRPLGGSSVGSSTGAPGTPGVTGGVPTAAASVGGAAMGTGAGMMPMTGRGAHGGGEDEHQAKHYVTPAGNETNLTGDLGTVTVPVLGADDAEESSEIYGDMYGLPD